MLQGLNGVRKGYHKEEVNFQRRERPAMNDQILRLQKCNKTNSALTKQEKKYYHRIKYDSFLRNSFRTTKHGTQSRSVDRVNGHKRPDRYFSMEFSKHRVSMEEYVHQVCLDAKSAVFCGARGICILGFTWGRNHNGPHTCTRSTKNAGCHYHSPFLPFALTLSPFLFATQQPAPLTALSIAKKTQKIRTQQTNRSLGSS